jgi:hypothetical protein
LSYKEKSGNPGYTEKALWVFCGIGQTHFLRLICIIDNFALQPHQELVCKSS